MKKHEYMITRIHSEGGCGSGVVYRTTERDMWIRKIRKEMQERGIPYECIVVMQHDEYTVCCMADTRPGYAALREIASATGAQMRSCAPKEVLA